MKKTIKLNERDLHKIVGESVHKLLTESKMEEYEKILQNEFMNIQKDIQSARATFHRGIRKSLLSKGYVVVWFCDNFISFYGPSRLFCFYAHEDYDNYKNPWKVSDRIKISFANYTWKERYQYPNYYHDMDYKEIRISEFPTFYQKVSKEIGEPLILKPFKAAHETVDDYKKFHIVKENGHNIKLGEFDNFKEAKEAAYKFAQAECDFGKKLNDSTSKYYHRSPIDVTKEFAYYAAAYEYYNYEEHSCYIVVYSD